MSLHPLTIGCAACCSRARCIPIASARAARSVRSWSRTCAPSARWSWSCWRRRTQRQRQQQRAAFLTGLGYTVLQICPRELQRHPRRALRRVRAALQAGRPMSEGTVHQAMAFSPVLEYVQDNSITGLDAMLQPRPAGRPDLDSEELGSTALTAFFNITQRWGLSAEEERTLLGAPPRSTFFKWKSERAAKLSADTVERISYVMGIYKALRILLPTAEAAHAWVKKPNAAYGFAGKSALERMLGGRVVDLADVRRYLDAERG